MSKPKVSPMTAAFMLAACLGISGQRPVQNPGHSQAVVKEGAKQTENTRTTVPMNQTTQRLVARIAGGGPDPRSRRNPLRQARRLFESMGLITSGRQWRNFKKLSHRDPKVADLIRVALTLSPAERLAVVRVAKGHAA